MDAKWFAVGGAVIGGFVIGTVVSAIVRRTLGAEKRDEKIREVASALAGLVFSVCLIAGLWIALAIADPTSVEDMPKSISSAMPNVVVALIMVIGSRVLGSILAVIAGQALETATGRRNPAVERAVAGVMMAFGVVLALNQLDVSPTVINILVAGIVFALASSFALLVGFGGRGVARDISAGRALRSTLVPGTHVRSGMASGTIVTLHPVSVEVVNDAGESVHVPYHLLLESTIQVGADSAGPVDD